MKTKKPKTIKSKSGFTLIELSLAIGFIGVIVLIVAMLISNIISIYRKGITMKTVNSTAQNLIDDFSATISESPAKDLVATCETFFSDDTNKTNCKGDNAYQFTYQVHYGTVEVTSGGKVTKDENVPLYGAFCTGNYSYIWNSGYLLGSKQFGNEYYYIKSGGDNLATLKYNGKTWDKDIHLLKVSDPSRSICSSQMIDSMSNARTYSTAAKPDASKSTFTIEYTSAEPEELLSIDNNTFALYSLYVARPAQDSTSKNALYSASFILATVRGGINITATGDYCTPPNDYEDNFDYCAINKFNFAIRASGE